MSFPTITPAALFRALGVGGVEIGFAFKGVSITSWPGCSSC